MVNTTAFHFFLLLAYFISCLSFISLDYKLFQAKVSFHTFTWFIFSGIYLVLLKCILIGNPKTRILYHFYL